MVVILCHISRKAAFTILDSTTEISVNIWNLKEKTTLLDNDFQAIRAAIMMKTTVDQNRIVTHESTNRG